MTIIDEDPRIRLRRPLLNPDAAPAHIGPPLQRRAGHFKIKDKVTTPDFAVRNTSTDSNSTISQ